MNEHASGLNDTIIPKSDQLNAEQLMNGPMTVSIVGVKRGNSEQPVIVHYADQDGRPFKPCKSMRRVLVFAWGDDGAAWVGKQLTLYNDPEVKYGGVKVGGIRISHMSDIPKKIELALSVTRGKREIVTIQPMKSPKVHPRVTEARAIALKGTEALLTWRKALPQEDQRELIKFADELKATAALADAPAPEDQPEEPQP